MELTQFDDAQAFLDETESALEQNEALNGLILGVARRIRDGERPPPADGSESAPPLLLAAERHSHLVLAALQTPPQKMVLYCTPEHCDAALDVLLTGLLEMEHALPGVIGPDPMPLRFSEAWTRQSGQTYRSTMSTRVYELREVRYSGATPGRLRVADEGDLDLLVEWMLCFNRDVGMHSHPMDVLRPQVTQRIARQGLYIWEDGGQPMSVAGPSRPTAHGMTINAVYTPPELRDRGYSTACVAALSQLMLDTGKEFCTLFADKTNPTSNSIYQRIGYDPVGSFTEYAFAD